MVTETEGELSQLTDERAVVKGALGEGQWPEKRCVEGRVGEHMCCVCLAEFGVSC